jgi:hypothetical protein
MDLIRGIFGVSLILFALLLTGCSQVEKIAPINPNKLVEEGKQFVNNATQIETEEVCKFLVNQEQLIEKAKELGFNTEIIAALCDELNRNPFNQEIIELLKFHIYALMQEKSINESHKKLADSLANNIKAIGPINETFFDDYDTFYRQTYRINHIAKTLNQEFGTQIPEIDLSKENFMGIQEIRKALGYSALIDSYNKLYESAEKLPSNRDEDYWEFYKNLFLFMADFYFLEEKVAYQASFKTTGIIATKLGLAKTQAVLGPKGYGLLLSEIHWMLRGEINEGWAGLLEALRENSLI